MNPDLVKVTEIFLVPSSFIVAALGTADTNAHRAIVSLLGLVVSVLWLVCCLEALPKREAGAPLPRSLRARILACVLPAVFIIGWSFAGIIHLWLMIAPV